MRLLLTPMNTDRSLGRLVPTFPLILDETSQPASPWHEYLVFKIVGCQTPLHPRTGIRHGRALLDFTRYLEIEGVRWDQEVDADVAPILRYADWQVATRQRHTALVTTNLVVVCDMYQWALETRRIRRLTFDRSTVIEHMRNLSPNRSCG